MRPSVGRGPPVRSGTAGETGEAAQQARSGSPGPAQRVVGFADVPVGNCQHHPLEASRSAFRIDESQDTIVLSRRAYVSSSDSIR